VKTNIFLTNLSEFSNINAVYQDFFAAPYPARTTLEVSALPLGAKVEVELIVFCAK
jgi:2-iminobutanoate/2-iminopropanoate deaminase